MTNESSGEPLDIEVTYNYLEHSWRKGLPLTDVITENYTAFLDKSPEDLKSFLPNLQEIRLRYRLVSHLPKYGQLAVARCFSWVFCSGELYDRLLMRGSLLSI